VATRATYLQDDPSACAAVFPVQTHQLQLGGGGPWLPPFRKTQASMPPPHTGMGPYIHLSSSDSPQAVG
jgi:hypothetical protein